MENKNAKIINQPLVNTFGWLHANGAAVENAAEPTETKLSLKEGEEKILIAENALKLKATVAKGANLKLIHLRRENKGTQISDIDVTCDNDAEFSWYRIILGGDESYDNCSVKLEGEGSAFNARIGFRLKGAERLDINCESIHTGKRTVSDIKGSGVLSDKAFKKLNGTIDFRSGCAGAVGNEAEDVLLLSESVHNQSLPVILCSEEDVVGNHGATIGRLDENLIYYLETRGMEKEEITRMMAKARVDAIISSLPDGALRKELLGEEGEDGLE